jgi:hypothetical protein
MVLEVRLTDRTYLESARTETRLSIGRYYSRAMSIKVHHLNFSRSLRVLWLLEELECTMFLHYAEGSIMPPLLVSLIFARLRSAPMPFFIKPIARGIADKVDRSYTRPALDLHLGFVLIVTSKALC